MTTDGPHANRSVEDLARQADQLRRLHHADKPLVLPNVWDAASARLVEAAGFPVIATSSGAVAAALGYEDEDSMAPEEAFGAVSRVASSVGLPVTADIEAGYRLEPEEVASRLLEAGAVGCNFEDTDHHGPDNLVDTDRQAARISAINGAAKDSGVDIVINARVDIPLRDDAALATNLEEAVERAKAYLAAGATSVYPINLSNERGIGAFVERVQAPVNIWLRKDSPDLSRLTELGVRRVSMAGGLMRRAYGALNEALKEIADTER